MSPGLERISAQAVHGHNARDSLISVVQAQYPGDVLQSGFSLRLEENLQPESVRLRIELAVGSLMTWKPGLLGLEVTPQPVQARLLENWWHPFSRMPW